MTGKETIDPATHLHEFVNAFVVPARRDRWLLLLSERDDRTFKSSSKLMQALDPRYCEQVGGGWGRDRSAGSRWDHDEKLRGVFYDFHDEPRIVTLAEAEKEGEGRDALFSMIPGTLAIHFSHEGWSWLCRK